MGKWGRGAGRGGGGVSDCFDKLTKNPNLNLWAGLGELGGRGEGVVNFLIKNSYQQNHFLWRGLR